MSYVIGNEKAGLLAQLEKRVDKLENKFAEFEERYVEKDFVRSCSSGSRKKLKRREEVEKRVDKMENKFADFEERYVEKALRSCSRKKLKRREEEEDEFFKSKIGIFIHVVGGNRPHKYTTASRLFKIEMDSDKYSNPSPSFMSFQIGSVTCKSKPQPIKPLFNFTFKHRYPLGMTCVLFRPKHHLYFMGGSITYTLLLNKSRDKPSDDLLDKYDILEATDSNMYPPNIYVFDCFTCQLLSPQHSPPPMNSGKSAHPFTFIHQNKLYVLSSSTNVPRKLHMFEVFDPDSRTWTILKNPPYDSRKLDNPLGSVLIDGVFFVSYAKQYGFKDDNPVHIFSYNILDNEWNKKISVCRPLSRDISIVPTFDRDSVFVQNKLYSANANPIFGNSDFQFPILSYGPIPTAAKLDARAFDAVVTPNLTPIFPLDACWPTYDGGKFGHPYARLVHLGGLLQGTKTDTTCFGFVQVLGQICNEEGFYIRFVAFEAFNDEITKDSDAYKGVANYYFKIPYECGPFFKARTLHASHFHFPHKEKRTIVNAVCALILS